MTLFRCKGKPDGEIRDRDETESVAFFGREEMPPLALPYDLDDLFR